MCGVRPDFTVRYGSFWLRPLARAFTCHLLNDPRCQVAFYTSMKSKNMRPIVQEFDRHFRRQEALGALADVSVGGSVITSHTSLFDTTIGIFDRPFNRKDPNGARSWDTVRDLTKIWSDPRASGYGPTNTIMIEATPHKARFFTENTIHTNEFTADAVMHHDDDTLGRLRQYLDEVAFTRMQTDASPDIRSILADTPFRT